MLQWRNKRSYKLQSSLGWGIYGLATKKKVAVSDSTHHMMGTTVAQTAYKLLTVVSSLLLLYIILATPACFCSFKQNMIFELILTALHLQDGVRGKRIPCQPSPCKDPSTASFDQQNVTSPFRCGCAQHTRDRVLFRNLGSLPVKVKENS